MNTADQPRFALGTKTQDLAERAAKVMPGRQSNLRALPEPPVFIDRAKGQRLWDVDGRELLDFAIGMGPGIWGHGNREYQDALHAQLESCLSWPRACCRPNPRWNWPSASWPTCLARTASAS
ncbi:MAG: aminotransferase class III-fold pyridoxal phosphate-dependent enzyme [Ideonella sp.]|nr:aminotransferase class III-fold pyridoxal phosphate-dependent enzyme [Ideonella sp.]